MPNYVQVSDGTYQINGSTIPVGTAVNRVLWDGTSEFPQPPGLSLAAEDGSHPMWENPQTVPVSVEKWQIQVVLAQRPGKSGTLLDDANALAAQVGGVAAIAWNGASEITRISPLMNQMAPTLGLSQADIDAIFIAAASVIA